MKIPRQILFLVLSFLAGAGFLVLLAFLQHHFLADVNAWTAFLAPVLFGGLVGVLLFRMSQRNRELSEELSGLFSSEMNLSDTALFDRRASSPWLLLLTTLGGCLLLSSLSVAQKLIIGIPIRPRGFVIPVPIGSLGGFLFGFYLYKIKNIQSFQAAALGAVANEKKRLDHIIRAIRDGICVTDREGCIAFVNPACRQLLGEGAEALPGRELWSSLLERIVPYQADRFPESLHNGSFLLQARQTGKVLRALVSPVLNDKGEEVGQVLVLQDLSDEKKVERLKSEFISAATHELNTPIAALVGYSDLLMNETFDADKRKEFLDIIGKKAWQISYILDDLLNLDRLGSSRKILLDRCRHRVSEIVEDQVADCFDQARETHELALDIRDPESVLEVDMKRVKRVFCHLVDNAAKFSPQGSLVRVRGCAEEGHYRFEVEDRGIGMSAQERERIFDVFYKIDGSDTARAGIGLGMSVVKSLVEAHDGALAIDSEPGRGTRVSFTFPLT